MKTEELERGIRLFKRLAERANKGECIGIGYQQFCCFLHDVETFRELKERTWKPGDSAWTIGLAEMITDSAGRISVTKHGVTLETGMDTYIWNEKPPHERPVEAFNKTNTAPLPYTRQQFERVFPLQTRRLITNDDLYFLL
jgi:hypothetical protein